MTRLRRLLRAVKLLATDRRIPRPVRWILLASLLPVPGPFDEVVGLIAIGIIFVFWRPVLREALSRDDASPPAGPEP